MTDRELKKMSRAALGKRLLEVMQENEELHCQLRIAGEKLADRQLKLENAGSIAEAAVSVNGVFEAAQEAASQYLENIRELSKRQEEICAARDEESRRDAERLLLETQRQCERMQEDARRQAAQMIEQAQRQADVQWSEISGRLEAFYQSHQGLKELVANNRQYFRPDNEE